MEAEALEKRGTCTKNHESTREGSERSLTDPRLAAEKNMETWTRKEKSESGKKRDEKPNIKRKPSTRSFEWPRNFAK